MPILATLPALADASPAVSPDSGVPVVLDTIAAAAAAAAAAVTARDAEAMVRVHMDLVHELAGGLGANWGQQPCAAAAMLIARMVVPHLDADTRAECPESRGVEPEEAAAITDCLGLNLLILLGHRRVAQA